MKQTCFALTAALIFCSGFFTAKTLARPVSAVLLENARVKVTEVVYEPGVPRPRSVRPTDEVIVFLNDCRYERTDPVTGEKTIRERRPGEVIWHAKGEDAPILRNVGALPYRTILIELP